MSADPLAWLMEIRALVYDMDGVLWRGKEVLPGLNEIFDWMDAERIPYLLATNNSMSTARRINSRSRRRWIVKSRTITETPVRPPWLS